VLATADLHVVPLRAGLGNVSVPSKTYSILAAGRPLLAAIDPGTEVPRLVEAAGAGSVVPPDDADAFVRALGDLLADPVRLRHQGEAARQFVEHAVSPRAVAEAYAGLISQLTRQRARPGER
jgi:colanic acid biosynthesis glycosyl transferase WcaI